MTFVTLLILAGQTVPATPPVIMVVSVQKLPATYQRAPVVHVDFNGNGAVSACIVEQSSGHPGVDKVACQQVQASITVPADKRKAPESRSATVDFVAGTLAPARD